MLIIIFLKKIIFSFFFLLFYSIRNKITNLNEKENRKKGVENVKKKLIIRIQYLSSYAIMRERESKGRSFLITLSALLI